MTFRLHLKNFQSIKEATLDIAPLTFLVGPNAAGKSAVADALSVLSWNFGRQLAVVWSDIRKFQRVPDEEMTVGIGCDFRFDGEDSPFFYPWMPFSDDHKQALVMRECDLHQTDVHLRLTSGDVLFHYGSTKGDCIEVFINGTLALVCDGIDTDSAKVSLRRDNVLMAEIISELNIERLFESDLSDGAFTKTTDSFTIRPSVSVGDLKASFGVKISDYYEGPLAYFVIEYVVNALLYVIAEGSGAFSFGACQHVGELPHIGPLRVIPHLEQWRIDQGWHYREHLKSVDAARWHDGAFAWFRIAQSIAEAERVRVRQSSGLAPKGITLGIKGGEFPVDGNLVGYVARLNAALNGEPLRLGYSIAGQVDVQFTLSECELPVSAERLAAGDYLVRLQVVDQQGKKHLLSDVGVGISQLIPVLFAGLTERFSIIEQPELHLHPKLQLELASFFIERVGEGASFVLETHSENMFLRVLRAIRETSASDIQHRRFNLKPEQVSVLYFERLEEYTEVRRLRISEEGEFIDRWPDGFFAEREAELF